MTSADAASDDEFTDDPTGDTEAAEPMDPTDSASAESGGELGESPFGAGDVTDVLAAVEAERDEYLDLARRLQADFENYRKRVDTQRVEVMERANEDLVRDLLPVLDAFAAAGQHGSEVEPLVAPLFGVLTKRGLATVDTSDVEFDPEIHEAVMTEEGDGGDAVVVEVLRAGYLWNGRVLRAAMVKVRS